MADPEKISDLSPQTRKLLIWIGLGAALFFFLLQLIPPILKYVHSPYAGLSAELAHGAELGLPALVLVAGLLVQMGILPSVQRRQGVQRSSMTGLKRLALWIVIALVLVFLFNFFQGTKPGSHPVQASSHPIENAPLFALFINWFPMLVIFGVWLFFLRQFQAKKDKDLGKS